METSESQLDPRPVPGGQSGPNREDAAVKKCPDCGIVAPNRYCPNCGIDTARGRLDLREIIADGFGHLLDFDRPFWSTVRALIARPGETARAYVSGRRRTFASPFRMFLVFATLATIAKLISGRPLNILGGAKVTISSSAPPASEQLQQSIFEFARENAHLLNLALIPILALVYVPLFRKRSGFNFAEQLVGVFYAYAIVFFAEFVVTPWLAITGWLWASAAFFLLSVAYPIMFAIRFNQDRVVRGIGKGLLGQVVLYSVVIGLLGFILVLLPGIIGAEF